MTSNSAGPLPLKGTCSILALANVPSSSPAKWPEPPLPDDAKLTASVLLRAFFSKSGTVFRGESYALTNTSGRLTALEMGVKSVLGL